MQGHWLHSVNGYFLLSLLLFQPALGAYNLAFGGKKWFPDWLFRLHSFVGQIFVGFAMFLQVPMGILKIGYGRIPFTMWLIFSALLVIAYGGFQRIASKMKLRVQEEPDSEEEAEFARLENMALASRRGSQASRRGSQTSNRGGGSRRGSNVDTAHPTWALGAVYEEEKKMVVLEQKVERLAKRRMSMSDVLDIITKGKRDVDDEVAGESAQNRFGAGSDARSRRRASISEGMEARLGANMTQRMSMHDAATMVQRGRRGTIDNVGGGRSSVRRGSVDGGGYQGRRGSFTEGDSGGRASVRVAGRGTFRDMNTGS